MSHHVLWLFTYAQLLLAGFSLLVVVEQVNLWRWERSARVHPLAAGLAGATAAAFVANVGVVDSLGSPGGPGGWIEIRAIALCAVALGAIPYAARLAGRRVPWALVGFVGALTVARIGLWPTTDLVYAHREAAGVPVYGPLDAPIGGALLLAVFGYVCWIAWAWPAEGERQILNAGLATSVVLAVVTLTMRESATAELLTGYVPFPALCAVTALMRLHDRDALRRARDRELLDPLTGLPTRTALHAILDAATPKQAKVAVAFCGLDRFRTINEVHGHTGGDVVLRAVADRLRALAHPTDVVARFSGVEFAVARLELDTLEEFEDELRAVFEEPLATPSGPVRLTASVGIAVSVPGISPDELLRDAHTALYDAKEKGGAVTGELSDGLRSAVVYRADLEQRLAGALDRGEIDVHYQPIVRLEDRRIVGFEALARWWNGHELVPNAQWIPVAESTALIHEIGETVLVQAATQLTRWSDRGHDVFLTLNVSPRQLASPRFVHTMERCLASGAPADRLALEVTESLALDDHGASLLDHLRRTGVSIAIDDFGTGYNSLSAVSRICGDLLKIDRSIVAQATEPDGGAVLRAVIAMAHSLGLPTVGEGVETEAQEELLRDLECAYAQGYLYFPPLPASATWDVLGDSLREEEAC